MLSKWEHQANPQTLIPVIFSLMRVPSLMHVTPRHFPQRQICCQKGYHAVPTPNKQSKLYAYIGGDIEIPF